MAVEPTVAIALMTLPVVVVVALREVLEEVVPPTMVQILETFSAKVCSKKRAPNLRARVLTLSTLRDPATTEEIVTVLTVVVIDLTVVTWIVLIVETRAVTSEGPPVVATKTTEDVSRMDLAIDGKRPRLKMAIALSRRKLSSLRLTMSKWRSSIVRWSLLMSS